MDPEALAPLTRILQLSITPVALISGVGLILLSMTNRLGRVIDRSRELTREVKASAGPDDIEPEVRAELRHLYERARWLAIAVGCIAMSIFLAVLMVVTLFLMYVVHHNFTAFVLVLFGVCLLFLVTSIAFLLGDIFLSTKTIHLSVGRYVR